MYLNEQRQQPKIHYKLYIGQHKFKIMTVYEKSIGLTSVPIIVTRDEPMLF